MLTVSNELKNTFMKDERTIFVRIKIGNQTFDNINVISVDYDAGSLSGEVFAIGSTYSNSIKITFSELVEGLKELDEVTYEIGIKLANGTIEYVPMGVFVINDAIEMDRNNNKTTIECMDRMVMMGGAYVSSLTYPASIREVALEIANKAGIQVANTFDRLSSDVIAKPEGYTYREAIGLIAQFEAGFATFNRYGKLEIRTLSDPNFAIPPDNYFSKGLVKNEVFFRLGGISCTTDDSDTVIQSGNTAGNQVVLENRVMTKFLLDKIYQKIQTINYYPFSLSWRGNPVLEAGDWVEVEDLKGNKFKTPNLSYSLSFNGGLSAKSSAETVTQSDATYQYKSPLQQKIEWIHARIDAAGGNVVYEGIDEPANPKEGDLWFKVIGPDTEILIYRKDKDGNLFWDPQISTADINKVAKELEKLFEQADLDREKAEEDFETAKQVAKAYTDAEINKFDTKFDAETGAIRNEVTTGYNNAVTAGKAYTDVKNAEFDEQLLVVKTDLDTTVLKADDAVLKANKSIEDVGFMKTDLDITKANAIDALTKAQTATESFNTLSTSFDELTQTVGFKAEQATVDAVTRQVDQHELSIAANAQAITARLTSTQVDSLVSAKGYVNQAQLTATSTAWSLALTQVSTDLSNLEIGGRNLVIRNDEWKNRYLTGSETYPNPSSSAGNSTSTMRELISVTPGENLKFTKNSAGNDYWRVSWLNSSKEYVSRFVNTSNKFMMSVPSGIAYMWVSYPTDSKPKVEKGTKATDWSPAPEDMATLEQFTTIDATVKGLQTTVGNKADKTQVTQLATQWTQTTALVNGHTGQISNLGEQINLRVTAENVTDAILKDKTIKDTRNDNQSPYWYIDNYPKQEVREFKNRTVMGVPGSSTYVQVTTKVPWAGGTSGGVPVQIAESNDGTYQRTATSTAGSWLPWDKIQEAGKVLAQINLSTEGVLIAGKRIQLDGDVAMNAAFITKLDVQTLKAVTANIATIKTQVLTADVVTSVHLKVDNALIDKLTATTAVVDYLFAKTAFVNNLSAKTLTAITANITSIRSQVLTANTVDATMLKTDTAMINKLFATTALVDTLTAKTAFINSVKAIDISADRVTAGTLNAAKVTIINLDANRITSGSLTGANLELNLNTGMQTFYNPVSAGGNLVLTQGQIRFVRGGMGSRLINYHDEGIIIDHGPENTGYTRNTSLHLKGDKAYIQFISNAGLTLQRLESDSIYLTAYVNDSFRVQRYYGTGEWRPVKARSFETSGTVNDMEIIENWIRTTNANDTHIYIEPSRNGDIRVADRALSQYHGIDASRFRVSSERRFKSDITQYDNALSLLNTLTFHEYTKNGEKEIGLIADEAPLQLLSAEQTTVDLYSLISVVGRSQQELSYINYGHEVKLNQHELRIKELEDTIRKLEGKE